jgi:RNA methyltransferase, TrmH family
MSGMKWNMLRPAAPPRRVPGRGAGYDSRVSALIERFHAARTDPSLAVLEGFHTIKHAIRFGAEIESAATRDASALQLLATRLAPDVAPALSQLAAPVTSAAFDQLSPTPPETGVIAIAKRRVTTLADLTRAASAAPIVLLESPSHSGNIGAVIRVAAGAGAAAVITTGTNDPWNPGALRGSAGLHYALPVLRVETTDVAGRLLIVVDPDGDDLVPGMIPGNALLAFGSERSGLSGELLAGARARVRIPMQPGVSSLNLATAVAVVLYSWRLAR